MDIPKTLTGVTSIFVDTPRLRHHVLLSGAESAVPVIFLHGNASSALFFEEAMLALPTAFRGIAYDMRGYGWSEDKLIDATRGYRDWVDDLVELMDALKIEKAHLVGWSAGGGTIYRFVADHPARVLSVTLIAPVSPYGFGGTRGVEGRPTFEDHAGSGGGVVNREFVQRMANKDRSSEDPNSPRNVINNFYYAPPFRSPREEDFLTGMLMEKTGDDRYPGDFVPSPNWPFVAPGKFGPVNAWSLKYHPTDAADFIAAQPRPSVLWIRGDKDQVVSDNSLFDIAALGKLGFVPGWPGDEVAPPQPMWQQTRDVLQKYAAQGGSFEEHVIENVGHSPFIEKPDVFNSFFHAFLKKA
jgi:pimeloyl-ACP methyl ester carboxylesterase